MVITVMVSTFNHLFICLFVYCVFLGCLTLCNALNSSEWTYSYTYAVLNVGKWVTLEHESVLRSFRSNVALR